MPYAEQEIDHACSYCGLVTKGPHEGERVPDVAHVTSYKGTPISHGVCEECSAQTIRDAKLSRAKRDHLWWRKLGE